MAWQRGTAAVVVAMGLGLLAGCGRGGNAYQPPPPPPVEVATPLQQAVTTYLEYTGRTAGVETVEVRARVKGFLAAMHFTPGEVVERDQLLFTIDLRTFQVAVEQAEADLKGKQAAADITNVQYRKAQELLQRNAATQLEVDEWKAKVDQANAAVAFARATLEAAQLDLDFTQVKSPIDGIVSENRVDLGTLVGAGDPTLLTTVIRQDQVYAYFSASERDVLEIESERAARGGERRKPGEIPIEMSLANETNFPHRGVVDFADNTIDPATGTLRVRAVFDNPQRALLPGLFVRVRVPRATREMLLVPDAAVMQDQGGRYVLTVSGEGPVKDVRRRTVEVGRAVGGLRPITAGLSAEDLVIVNGVLRARDGGKVTAKATPLQPPAAQESPAGTVVEPAPDKT